MAQGRASSTSFTQQLRKVKEGLDKVAPIFLSKMAQEIVRLSPVDTGAYVTSHQISVNSRGLGGQFAGRLQRQPGSRSRAAQAARPEEALASLQAQIASIPIDTPVVVMNNTVPHAYLVEYAGWSSKPPYMVYQTARSKASVFLQEAKREAGFQ